jgi:pimeloyl-ACP methyl ester carboxylesterase
MTSIASSTQTHREPGASISQIKQIDQYDPTSNVNYFRQKNEYKNFKRSVPLIQITTLKPSEKRWGYYQLGDTSVEPLIILPDLCTTAESFFNQLLELSARGFNVISVNYPPCFTHDEFVICFDEFLDKLNRVDKIVHLMGAGLGGLLAQSFCEKKNHRIGSLIICNGFSDTSPLNEVSPFADLYVSHFNVLTIEVTN